MPPKKEPSEAVAALEADLNEIIVGRHGEKRIFLGIYRTLIAILKALESR